MELDLNKISIREAVRQNKANEWNAFVIGSYYITSSGSRSPEKFYIGSKRFLPTFGDAVAEFKKRLEDGTVKNVRGVLKWSGKNFYIDYYEGKEDLKPKLPKELEDLDKYKANLQKDKQASDPKYINALKKKLEEQKEKEVPDFTKVDKSKLSVGKVIADPICEDVMKLIDHTVQGSNSYGFNESVIGQLVDSKTTDEKPFKVKVGNKIIACSFVRSAEKKVVPYCLADPEVRKSLLGRAYKSKDGTIESTVYLFTNLSNDGWKINTISAQKFLSEYVWLDTGEPCGEC